MSNTYTDLPYTEFPNNTDSAIEVNDATVADAELLNTYNQYIANGSFSQAKAVLTNNPSLAKTFITAHMIKTLDQRTRAIERWYNSDLVSRINKFITFCGEYNKNITYTKNNCVSYQNGLWVYINDIDDYGHDPSSGSNYWSLQLEYSQNADNITFNGKSLSTVLNSKADLVNGKVSQQQAPSIFIIQGTAPSNTDSCIWIDSSNNNIPKYYNGASWVALAGVYS